MACLHTAKLSGPGGIYNKGSAVKVGGRLGAEPPFFKLGGGGTEPPFYFRKSRIYYVTEEIQSSGDTINTKCTHVQERQEKT